jgi:hypothetical protein
MHRLFRVLPLLIGCVAVPLASAITVTPSWAQTPACQPPAPSEYLLLVVTPTAEAQTKTFTLLPAGATASVCNYMGQTVTRVGGFTTPDTVNFWARYLNEKAGVSSVVVAPAFSSGQPTIPPLPVTPAPTLAYNPQPLGSGYAVLVSYFNQPELATQLRSVVAQPVGLVAYGQRSYLLALYTPDQGQANSSLQRLTDQGFWVMLVDARRVMLLRNAVTQ